MGTKLEINDTLQITVEQGFPADILDLEAHLKQAVTTADVAGKIFEFHDKPEQRIFHLDPVRVFLVQKIGGKWLFWGKIYIQSQTISKHIYKAESGESSDSRDSGDSGERCSWVTSGTYKIIDVFEPEYQKTFTIRESPPGVSYY